MYLCALLLRSYVSIREEFLQVFELIKSTPHIILGLLCLLMAAFASCSEEKERSDNLRTVVEHKVDIAGNLIESGDYVHALDTLAAACRFINMSQDIPDTLAMRTYFLMGKVHSIFGDEEGAISYYNKGLSKKTEDSNPEVLMKIYGNLYEAYASLGDYEAASNSTDSLLNVDIQPDGMKFFLYNFNRAHLASLEGDFDRSVELYHRALENIDGKIVKDKMKVFPYSELAETFRRMGKNDSAYFYLKKFEAAAEADSEPYVKVSALRELMLWSINNDNPAIAADFAERYFHLTDSLINIRAFLRTKENFRRYEQENSDHIISNMTESISKGQRIIVNLSLILLILGIVALFVIWRNAIIKKNNKFLFEKNAELSKVESLYRDLIMQQPLTRESGAGEDAGKTNKDKDSVADNELLSRILLEMELSKPYLDPDFSLQALADLTDSNTKYVSQAINEFTGLNFRNFINEYRIKEAERRLLDGKTYGNYTIQWIGESVGFKSKSTFVAAFKKITGLTPSVYIKLSQEKENDA